MTDVAPAAARIEPGEALDADAEVRAAESRWVPRVLLVDDDELCRLVGRRLLERLGLTVDIARDGREAVEMSARWRYVAIFMDCSMPRLDGYGATREIHERDGAVHTTLVVAMTSSARHVSVASGMNDHVAKPLHIDALTTDCRRLGLLAHPTGAATPAATAVARDAPLLTPPHDGAHSRPRWATSRAAGFVDEASALVPELWRTANRGDFDTIHRIARELGDSAQTVGAARVAAICQHMLDAAGDARSDILIETEPLLRGALLDTTEVIRHQLRAALNAAPSAEAADAVAEPHQVARRSI